MKWRRFTSIVRNFAAVRGFDHTISTHRALKGSGDEEFMTGGTVGLCIVKQRARDVHSVPVDGEEDQLRVHLGGNLQFAHRPPPRIIA